MGSAQRLIKATVEGVVLINHNIHDTVGVQAPREELGGIRLGAVNAVG